MLDAQTAAGKDQSHITRVGQGDGNAGGDDFAAAGGDDYRFIDTGVEIHGGGAGGGIEGCGDLGPDLGGQSLDFQFHNV